MGVVGDVQLQRDSTTTDVDARVPAKCGDCLLCFDVRERGDVVRALRDFRDLTTPRLFAVELENVLSDLGGCLYIHWNIRDLPYPVSSIYPFSSDGGHV